MPAKAEQSDHEPIAVAGALPITLRADANTVQVQLGDGDSIEWSVRPELEIDRLQIYCNAEAPKLVRFGTATDNLSFLVSGVDYHEFTIETPDGQRAKTAIECFPEPVGFKGDYAVSDPSERDYAEDLNSGVLSDHIEELARRMIVPGLAVAVVQDDKLLYNKAFGVENVKDQTAFSSTTWSRLASSSKFLTMLTVLSLAEEGSISLDAKLGGYVPGLRADWAHTPLWTMLNHTSGIPQILNNDAFTGLSDAQRASFSYQDLLETLSDFPLDYENGARFRYQQSAFALIAMIASEQTGKSWDELVREHILRPAGMEGTSYGDALTRHPQSYNLAKGELISPPYFYPPVLSTGAGYNSDIEDLTLLIQALNHGKIVSSEFLRSSIFNPTYLNGDTQGYGLSAEVKAFGETSTLGHSGGGGMAVIRYAPDEKVGIIVLSNREGSQIAPLIADEISELLFGER
ncbi:MAG: serine hydrolase domain-containing protein [Pseudomonadota bacterium]